MMIIMQDLAVDAGSRERIQPVESEALASEDDEPPTLDGMTAWVEGLKSLKETLQLSKTVR